MKTINYLMIATHLPSDSQILFFNTYDEAMEEFKKQTEGLLSLEDLSEDDYHIVDDYAIRFNAGNHMELSNMLGDVDHFFKLGTIDVDDSCTHYICDFSEFTDESTVEFYSKSDAKYILMDMVDKAISEQHLLFKDQVKIDKYDINTWTDVEGDLFNHKIINGNTEDFFFGYNGIYWTYRIGLIELPKKKYKVTKERFIDWYFSDVESRIDFGSNAIDELCRFGKLNVTIEGLFDTCGYIPSSICEGIDTEDLDEDLEPNNVELI